MEYYQILDLEKLTGIKAHTIRIWEKRYGLIVPHRTSTNIRYYDDDQVKKVLNVATLLTQGFKISKIAALTHEELKQHLANKFNATNKNELYTAYVNNLISATLTLDEVLFEQSFKHIEHTYGIFDAMINIIYPFLTKVGYMWTVDKSSSFQEHFATAIIRKKLMVAIDALALPAKNAKQFLLYLPPNEWHEVGLLFANYIIRSKGHRTIYLGQNVPYDNINEVISLRNFDYILTFYILNNSLTDAQTNILATLKLRPTTQVLLAGNQSFLTALALPPKQTTILNSVHSLFAHL